ncbi:MAG TPA: ATP-binding protein [Methylomirabilota bacterium]|nr:ATP-binding protein [Methylomirabilota bacterium]
MRDFSIKQKLTLLAMASSTLALLLVSAGFITYELSTFRKEMTDDLSSTAQLIGNQSRAFLTLGGTDKEVSDIWNSVSVKPHITAACLYRGTNIASLPYFRDKDATRLVPLHPGASGWQFDFGKDQLEGFEHIRLNGDDIGAVYLKSDLKSLYAKFFSYLGMTILFMVASSIVVYLFSLQLQRIIMWPIFHLAQTAKTITTKKNYSLRAQKESNDELGQLIDGFNEMLEQIQRRDAALQSVNMELEKARGELEIRVHERTLELREAQKIVMQQERLKALGQMASGIAHDVNNALSPIIGFAELINMSESGLAEKSKRHLKHIQTAAEDIAHIVSRLRDFYRTRDGDEPLQLLNLNKIVEQVIEMTAPRWRTMPQSHGITIEMQRELKSGLPEMIGIESELREVLTNLVINAVDAMPEGGNITVRTFSKKNISAETKTASPSHIILEICDTGVGMDEETRARCLEPFFSTKGNRGTGLGLSMVYGVVERHEGVIEIDSTLGKGTMMRLIFPIRKLEPAKIAESLPGGKIKPLHVLCIDDEPLQRELVKEMLERDGHKVETADSGESGVEIFRTAISRREPFEIVITDLGMPYVDGREVAKIIKQGSPATPVVLLTGWGEFISDDETALSDFDELLNKPPRLSEFREMFRRVIRPTAKGKKSSATQGA